MPQAHSCNIEVRSRPFSFVCLSRRRFSARRDKPRFRVHDTGTGARSGLTSSIFIAYAMRCDALVWPFFVCDASGLVSVVFMVDCWMLFARVGLFYCQSATLQIRTFSLLLLLLSLSVFVVVCVSAVHEAVLHTADLTTGTGEKMGRLRNRLAVQKRAREIERMLSV